MNQNEEVEIDLLDMCKYILSKWIIIIIGVVICAGVGFGYVKLKGQVQYTSKMQVYVTVPTESDKKLIIDNANELVADYVKMATTDLVLDEIVKESGVKKSIVKEALTAEQEEDARILNLTVSTDKSSTTKQVAKYTIKAMNHIAVDKLKKSKLVVLTEPGKVEVESTMSMKKYVAVGAAVGCILVVGCLFVMYLVKAVKAAKKQA